MSRLDERELVAMEPSKRVGYASARHGVGEGVHAIEEAKHLGLERVPRRGVGGVRLASKSNGFSREIREESVTGGVDGSLEVHVWMTFRERVRRFVGRSLADFRGCGGALDASGDAGGDFAFEHLAATFRGGHAAAVAVEGFVLEELGGDAARSLGESGIAGGDGEGGEAGRTGRGG